MEADSAQCHLASGDPEEPRSIDSDGPMASVRWSSIVLSYAFSLFVTIRAWPRCRILKIVKPRKKSADGLTQTGLCTAAFPASPHIHFTAFAVRTLWLHAFELPSCLVKCPRGQLDDKRHLASPRPVTDCHNCQTRLSTVQVRYSNL